MNGSHDPTPGTATPMTAHVAGVRVPLPTSGSHHVASCVAAMLAMVDADARGVTHLEIHTPNEALRKHARYKWRRKAPLLREFHPALKRLESRFEAVVWPD